MKQKKDSVFSDEAALQELLRHTPHPLRLDDVLRALDLSRREKKAVLACLESLVASGRAVRLRGGRWTDENQLRTLTGVVSVQRSGSAFVTPLSSEKGRSSRDLFIPENWIGDALHGDTVEVALLPGFSRGGSLNPEGRVLRVVKRGIEELAVRVTTRRRAVGLRPDSRRGSWSSHRERLPAAEGIYARPADPRFPLILDVDVSALSSVPEEDELLLVSLLEKREGNIWTARAQKRLGHEDAAEVQERLTRLNHSIPLDFPPNVEAEARLLARTLPASEDGDTHHSTGHRRDLRELLFVTIDGQDARDFDDAICVTGPVLWVAIADVSLYVRPRTALDREARERGNSCYFPQSVTPMLPEVLSTDLCSLRPEEDRAVMVARLVCDEHGGTAEASFFPAVIRSRARLTYDDAQAMLDARTEDGSADTGRDNDAIGAMLREAGILARRMMERRSRRGALDLDLPEAAFLFDAEGRVSGIAKRTRLFAHRLIEAFMLAANEAVAGFLTQKDIPFPLRAHPAPDNERLASLFGTLRSTELASHLPERPDARALRPLLDQAANTPQAALVSRLVLRAMMQARYMPGPAEPDVARHFGLASKAYCHFTSPIRRYADLMVHRALKFALDAPDKTALPAGQKLLALCDRCNECERSAQDAEREITRRLACLLLVSRIGETLHGVVSGVMEFGLFVEPDAFPVEGMIRLESLTDDWYVCDHERQELVGVRTGRRFRIGQPIAVRLVDVNTGRLEIDFVPAEASSDSGMRRNRSRGKEHRSGSDGRKTALPHRRTSSQYRKGGKSKKFS